MNPLCRMRSRALARYAALAAPLATETRLGRHVARCARCRGVWAELCSLAEELRGDIAAPAAPALSMERVWERVAAGEATRGHLVPPINADGRRWEWVWGRAWRNPVALAVLATLVLIVLLLEWPMVRGAGTRTVVQDAGVGHVGGSQQPVETPREPAADASRLPRSRRRSPSLLAGAARLRESSSPAIRGLENPGGIGTGIRVHPRRSAASAPARDDLSRLNEGSPGSARAFAPRATAAAPSPRVPILQERAPGGVLLDDLLALNPIRVAAADDAGVAAAAAALADAAPATDARLQQTVVVHATRMRLADLLERLSRATGVSLVARMEVADEKVSVWAEERTLMEVMRDLRHLHGFYWSRYGSAEKYVYALWQDAQSRAREEAELQQWVIEQQRAFEESIQRAVRALSADDAALLRLAQEDPYLVVQMKHPVVRGGYRLFAALPPDQQALLTRGQTPSRPLAAGHLMMVTPLETRAGDAYFNPRSTVASFAPRGDIVTLKAGELTPAQRAAVAALVRGAAAQWERDIAHEPFSPAPDRAQRQAFQTAQARTLAAADLATATVTLFRSGEPSMQSLSVRVEVQSGGRGWMVHSDIGLSSGARAFYNDQLRQGEFRIALEGQALLDRLLDRDRKQQGRMPPAPRLAAPAGPPDPILDAPVSLTWPLPLRDGMRTLTTAEVLAALQRDIRRPIVVDTALVGLRQLYRGPAELRVEQRPLREVLRQVAPGMEYHTSGGAIFIHDPQRLRERLNAVPRAVEELLLARTGPLTLEDMALLARSLTPWQIEKLAKFLPARAIDQLVAAQELLKLYGELAPAQRDALAQGVRFSALTPTQQQYFLACAQRQRPFMEPWRFQNGTLRLVPAAPPSTDYDGLQGPAPPVARMVFQVSFPDEETQALPIDLFFKKTRRGIGTSPAEWVGQRFPFPARLPAAGLWKPALGDARLRQRPLVLILSRPFVDPYAGLQPPPVAYAWVRALAEHLRDTSVTVVHIHVPGGDRRPPPREDPGLPHLIQLRDDGEGNGQPVDASGGGWWIAQWPTALLIDSDEIVQHVFEGQDACSVDAIARAARQLH